MSGIENPCLSLAIARLSAAGRENLAIWVLKAPYPGGMVHHDSTWSEYMTKSWLAWQDMFSPFSNHVPISGHHNQYPTTLPSQNQNGATGPEISYSGRLMQGLGIDLWQWLFQGSIRNALERSQGIALGQNKPLRLRLEVRAPDFIPLPWEIMQPMAGKQAISLSQQILFSRTTSDVDALEPLRSHQALNILLVLGEKVQKLNGSTTNLDLEKEAATLVNALQAGRAAQTSRNQSVPPVTCNVSKLIQPTPAELIKALETGAYNILFYAGHGESAPDGGLLFLRSDAKISGTELAQVLVRTQVALAVFNACWSAKPDQVNSQTIPRSSLAEVLIHQGVPAVLGMRDSIADQEAVSFIQSFAQALAERMPIDHAVAVARQHMLTLYKFNQPAWTLPILYMHPQFEGELIQPVGEGITELPTITSSWLESPPPTASLRSIGKTDQVWPIRGGLMRVGRLQSHNDLVIPEVCVSKQHAEIICRDAFTDQGSDPTYFLRDFSRNGTRILIDNGWKTVHHQEVQLRSGIQLKFGGPRGQIFEFIIDSPES
ncbi:CHAT domain-containing protein [Moorena producens]|uniref:CHAT domain-containing protein n=1 Tax=Moorena producens TaxID=1155739 RepID=UPI003C7254AD